MTKQIRIRLLLLSILVSFACIAHSKLVIETPAELKAFFNEKYPENGIPYSIANFGNIPYGKTLSGQIAIPSVLEDCVYEELPFDGKNKKIIMVERNDCTFTQKAINIQKQGGKMAIIMDSTIENPKQIVMVDDGKGGQIDIPTILISKEDGNKILQYVVSSQSVVSRISFEVIARTRAQISIWLDINDRKNFIFLRNFYPYYKKIQSHVDLSFGFKTKRCSTCSEEDCFFNKSYCITPKKKLGVTSGGQSLIQESLRQYYILRQSPNLWWEYMLQYDDRCDSLAILEDCSREIMDELDIKQSKIKAWVQNSFGNQDNSLLKQMQEFRDQHGIIFFPSIVVNSLVYRGNLEPLEVFELVCSSFTDAPSDCNGVLERTQPDIWIWVFFGIVSFTIFVIFLIVCYRRFIRRQLSQNINKQVNQLVNQYITMYQNEKFNGQPQQPVARQMK